MQQQIVLKGKTVTYTLLRKQVKNINLRIKRNGDIHLSAAAAVPLEQIELFLHQKEDWILHVLEQNKNNGPSLLPGQVYWYGSVVRLPSNCNPTVWQQQQASLLLPQAFQAAWHCFQPADFAQPSLKLKTMKSRWGSCIPSKGRITLNTALIGASFDCQVAVAAHELCHLLHPNHSKAFYRCLIQHFPEYERCHRQLNLMQSQLLFCPSSDDFSL